MNKIIHTECILQLVYYFTLYIVCEILAKNPGGGMTHMSVQDVLGGSSPWSTANQNLSFLHPPISTMWKDAMAMLEASSGSLAT